MTLRSLPHTLLSALLLILWHSAGADPASSTSPSFAASQVTAGRLVYARACGICHGANLQGGAAVALSGSTFARTWGDGHHLGPDFFDAIAKQMPKNAPGTLSAAENLALTAFILASNGYAAGPQPLTRAALAGVARAALARRPACHRSWRTRLPPAFRKRRTACARRVVPSPAMRSSRVCRIRIGSPSIAPCPGSASRRFYADQHRQCEAPAGAMHRAAWRARQLRNQSHRVQRHHVRDHGAQGPGTGWRELRGEMVPYTWSRWIRASPGQSRRGPVPGPRLRGTTDGHLIALDAANGALLWDARVADGGLGYEITGAPVAFDGKVFTGDAGADTGIRGRIYAFDAASGRWYGSSISCRGPGCAPPAGAAAPRRAGVPPGPAWPSIRCTSCCSCPPEIPRLISTTPVAVATICIRIRWSRWTWPRVSCPGTCSRCRTTCMTGTRRPHRRCSRTAAGASWPWRARMACCTNTTATVTRPCRRHPSPAVRMWMRCRRRPVCTCVREHRAVHGRRLSPLDGRVFVAAADHCNLLTRAEPHYVPGGVYFGGMFRMDPPAAQSGWIKAFAAVHRAGTVSVHRRDPVLAAVTPTAGGLLLTGDLAEDNT